MGEYALTLRQGPSQSILRPFDASISCDRPAAMDGRQALEPSHSEVSVHLKGILIFSLIIKAASTRRQQ